MSSCIPRKKTRRVRFFQLDDCGRLPQDTVSNLVLDWSGFESIEFSDRIDDGDAELIINTEGEACVDDESCPVDRGVDFTFTECKENWSFLAMTGHGDLAIDPGTGLVVGFDRKKSTNCPPLAAEILFEVPSLCDDTGAAQCVAMLVPSVRLFKQASSKTVNSTTTVRGSYTARAALNSRFFELWETTAGGGVLPAELAYWQPWLAELESGDVWHLNRVIDCPALSDARDCELRPIDVDANGAPIISE